MPGLSRVYVATSVPGHRGHLSDGPFLAVHLQFRPPPVVVLEASLALLLLGDRNVEVEVEVAAQHRCPGKGPPHPPLVFLQLLERRT